MPSNYYYTEKGVSCRLYNNLRTNSKRRGHSPPSYDLTEFRVWLYSQPNFEGLYRGWVKSGYKTADAISIDRKDNYKGYEFCNMRIMTWDSNNKRANQDMRKGILKNGSNPQKPVIMSCEFPSLREAERRTGIDHKKISTMCHNEGIDAWKFKEENTKKVSKDKLCKAFFNYISASIEVYNLTCETGAELTMGDVINHLQKRNKE